MSLDNGTCPLDSEAVLKLREAYEETRDVAATAQRMQITEQAFANALAGLPVRKSTRALIRANLGLPRLDAEEVKP